MPSLGPAEILVVLVIALLVFGPNKMPDIARQVGKGFREFRRVQQHLKSELRDVVSEFDSPSSSAHGRAAAGADAPAEGHDGGRRSARSRPCRRPPSTPVADAPAPPAPAADGSLVQRGESAAER